MGTAGRRRAVDKSSPPLRRHVWGRAAEGPLTEGRVYTTHDDRQGGQGRWTFRKEWGRKSQIGEGSGVDFRTETRSVEEVCWVERDFDGRVSVRGYGVGPQEPLVITLFPHSFSFQWFASGISRYETHTVPRVVVEHGRLDATHLGPLPGPTCWRF